MKQICVVPMSDACLVRAEEIADSMGLAGPSLEGKPDPEQSSFQLLVAEDGLSVKKTGSNQNPLRVDFNTASMDYRRVHSSRKNESIARAVGISSKWSPTVVDATAGLGKDSFILAALGCQVIMLERSLLMSLLLEDGLRRASETDALAAVADRMTLEHTDACDWIERQRTLSDRVVYLDPMFPDRSRTALSRGDMQVMQEILGTDENFNTLFACARASGANRIVLKRPLRGSSVSVKPTFSLKGKASRFDVFIQ